MLRSRWSVVDDDPKRDPSVLSARTPDAERVPAVRVELVRDVLLRDLLMCRVPNDQLAARWRGPIRHFGAGRDQDDDARPEL